MKYIKFSIYFLIAATTIPFFLLFFDIKWELFSSNTRLFYISLASILSRIEGLIGVMLFMWQLVLGNRFLLGKYIKDTVWLSKIHKYLGIYATVLIFAHPLLQMYIFGENLLFLITPDFATEFQKYLSFGRGAYLIFTTIWLSSALLRKKIPYRAWHYIHALVYPLILLSILHSKKIGTTINTYPFLNYLWIAMLIAIVATILHRWGWVWSGLGKKKYTINSIKKYNGGVVVLTMLPVNKGLAPKLGQYCYISIRKFGESHPFSVMNYNNQSREITFGIKDLGKFTKKINLLEKGTELLLDGPYGVFTQEGQNDKPKVFIAGGIGITPFVGVIEKHGDKNTYLLNCNRSTSEAVDRDLLIEKLGDTYIDILSEEKTNGPQIENGFLTAEIIKKRIPEEILLNAPIFFCGNKKFYEITKKNLVDIGAKAENIFYEEFSL